MSRDGPDKIAEVLRLSLVEGLSIRAISRRLSIGRPTVRKILGRTSHAPAPQKLPRVSLLDPYIPFLQEELKRCPELTAPTLLERLRARGYTGGITILRDRIRELRPRKPKEAFLTLEHRPGATLQVDWADFGFAIPGCPRRVSAFVAMLAYSRLLYLEFTLSQRMGAFLRAMEASLHFFGGLTDADVFDNMKTVVIERTQKHVRFNPRFLDYARNRGFAVTACNARRANEKGVVERGIGFVRRRFWPGRRFRDLFDLNRQATEWRQDFANNRIHETTGKIPSLVFRNEERRHLKPVPDRPFNTDDVESCGVTKTFRVRFDRNLYSVPWRLVGQQVVVRSDAEWVRIYLAHKQVGLHKRSWDVGQNIEHPSHKEGLLARKPKAAAGSLPLALGGLSEVGRDYFKLLAANTRSIRHEVVRLVFLVEIFGYKPTAEAMAEVLSTGHVGAEYIEYVLRYKKRIEPAPPPLSLGDPELDEISLPEPDLQIYDDLPARHVTKDPGPSPQDTDYEG